MPQQSAILNHEWRSMLPQVDGFVGISRCTKDMKTRPILTSILNNLADVIVPEGYWQDMGTI
jgi:hypothetical protein